ncbi:MAG: radical SAM family heme chaperone HemW [Bacteroidota bacterium]|nr:radical SAM family heme chaperone HemW [Bacteroidota bacterium]
MAGIYVHIPFCKKACNYCNFHFSTKKNYSELVNSILKEIELNQKSFDENIISTIYFGGGTPSIIDSFFIEKIINKLNKYHTINQNCEITLEANPDDITIKKLNFWKKIGVNRISLGVQSFNDDILIRINRSHNSNQAINAINRIQEIFNNFSIDLMFGTPLSNTKTILLDLKKLKEIRPPHVAIYNMTVEKDTKMYTLIKKNKIVLPTDDEVIKQYDIILEKMLEMDYENYEISNFSKRGFISKHNSNYWKNEKYIGYGPGAHSYDKENRYWNINDNEKYIKSINNNNLVYSKEKLKNKEKINEYILTRIRTSWGIDNDEMKSNFDFNLLQEKNKVLELLTTNMLISQNKNKIKLTNKGKKIADHITEKIMI